MKFFENIKHKKMYKQMKKNGIIYHEKYMPNIFSFMIDNEIKLSINNKKGIFKILKCGYDWKDNWGSPDVVLELIRYEDEKDFKDMTFDEFIQSGILIR